MLRVRADSERGVHIVDERYRTSLLSYKQLYDEASRIATALTQQDVGRGTHVVLQLSSQRDYLVGFWGSILGGFVPVPLHPARTEELSRKLDAVLKALPSPIVLADDATASFVDTHPSNETQHVKDAKRLLSFATLSAADAGEVNASANESDVAFIQFSSGSTGSPKGIVITHANVLANVHGMISRTRATRDDVSIAWMPLTHDMGLIGFHLAPLVLGMNHYVMKPTTFLRRPAEWLALADRSKATVLSSPSFGLDYTVARTDPSLAASLDLSRVRLLFVGADYVSPITCRSFAERFRAARFSADALYPVYGLAESTVAVTFPDPGTGARVTSVKRSASPEAGSIDYVFLGRPIDGVEIKIADESSAALSEGTPGRILVRGTSLSRGVFQNGTEAPWPLVDGYLDTGDLGFLERGELVMVGRDKDLVSVAGENHYLADIDRVARAAATTDVAAFVEVDHTHGERVGLAVQTGATGADFSEIEARVRRALLSELGLPLSQVRAVSPLPRTTSGKVRRAELAQSLHTQATPSAVRTPLDEEAIARTIVDTVIEVTGQKDFRVDDAFLEKGIPSLALIDVAARLEPKLSTSIREVDLFSYPTPRKLAQRILSGPSALHTSKFAGDAREPIAIVGMSVRVPGADTLDAFWASLEKGVCTVGSLPNARRADVERYLTLRDRRQSTVDAPIGSYLERVDEFDAEAFGLSTREASLIHPTHRLFLELTAEAMGDAGIHTKSDAPRSVGLFVGHVGDFEGTDYRQIVSVAAPELLGVSITGNLSAFLAGRIAHRLGFTGPALMVDTACSASLVAVHLAADALRRGECDVAIAGGARTSVLPLKWPTHMGFESTRGEIRPFDRDADGTLLGEGGAAVVLKRLSDALRDGDRIYATVRGAAMNHDGSAASMTAPNPRAQAEVMRRAWDNASTTPESLLFIETHGAATVLSDSVEVEAIAQAFKDFPSRTESCPLGSIKANFGHLFEAAGIVAFAKSALSLHHQKLPPTVGHRTPNPRIPFAETNVHVNTSLRAIPTSSRPHERTAGVTSIGFSGTNCHVVLGEAPSHTPTKRAPVHVDFLRKRCWVDLPEPNTEVSHTHSASETTVHASELEVAAHLSAIVRRYSGLDLLAPEDDARSFFELGLDSLVLIQIRQAVEKTFHVKIAVQRFFDDILSPKDLTAHLLDENASLTESARSATASLRSSLLPGAHRPHPTDALPKAHPRAARQRVSLFHDRYAERIGTALGKRSPTSKALADRHRTSLANNRSSAGFRPAWKELTFPLYFKEAKGAHFTDVDNQRYLDITMGFGVHLFGHNPTFLTRELSSVVENGALALGPMHPVAGDVAELLCTLSGTDRAAFYNSGTEAVMVALRLARTFTERKKVVIFRGSYHGSFDPLLALSTNEDGASIPFTFGTPDSLVSDTLVLEYGSPHSLDVIWKHADQIAAVLVEPIQSRRPDFQPDAFLHELRYITAERGVALVFDEVITGFRMHPGGAQALFDVRADLVAYGKVVGGGMPIGVVAGKRAWMDGVDGGAWKFGDQSQPTARTTFVAGTFCHHPLAMHATHAVLKKLSEEGDARVRDLNALTAKLTAKLNTLLAARETGMRVSHAGSLFRFQMPQAQSLFYSRLLLEGVYVWEGRNCFLSTEHTDADIDELVSRVDRVVCDMKDAGLFREDATRERAPLHSTQRRTFERASSSTANSCVGNQSAMLLLEGTMDRSAVAESIRALSERHDALRVTRISADGVDLSSVDAADTLRWTTTSAKALVDAVAKELATPFDFEHGPFLRWRIYEEAPDRAHLLLVAHRTMFDGYSMGVLLEELSELYSASVDRRAPNLPASVPFDVYTAFADARNSSNDNRDAVAINVGQIRLTETQPPRGGVVSEASTVALKMNDFAFSRLKEKAAEQKSTVFVYSLTSFIDWLSQHFASSESEPVTVGVPIAGQPLVDAERLVGQCVEVVPVSLTKPSHASRSANLESVRTQLGAAYASSRSVGLGQAARVPNVVFNLDRSPALHFSGLVASYAPTPSVFTSYDLVVNLVEESGTLHIECKHRKEFKRTLVEQWMKAFEKELS